MSRRMDQRTAYGLDRINKIYRIEEQDAGLSLCVRPASTPHFRPTCKYSTILPSKMKFSQGMAPWILLSITKFKLDSELPPFRFDILFVVCVGISVGVAVDDTVPFPALHCALQRLTLCSLEPYTVLNFKKTVGFERGSR